MFIAYSRSLDTRLDNGERRLNQPLTLQLTLIEAGERGRKLDNTDLARILRVPGTYNLKGPEPKRVEILQMKQDTRYNVADFEPYHGRRTHGSTRSGSDIQNYDGPPPDFEQLRSNCNWGSLCKDATTLPNLVARPIGNCGCCEDDAYWPTKSVSRTPVTPLKRPI